MTAEELLSRAKTVYGEGVSRHREAMLETGRLLHEYVLAALARMDGTSVRAANRRGVNRKGLIVAAGEALGAEAERVNHMIAAAMVVQFLSGDGALGGLAWQSIARFAVFIRRRKWTVLPSGKKRPPEAASEMETWEIKGGFAASAPALFRRAVEEGWTQRRVSEEVIALSSRTGDRRRPTRIPTPDRTAADVLCRSVARASSGDVADLCMRLVEGSEDPAAVAVRLRSSLDALLAVKQRRKAAV